MCVSIGFFICGLSVLNCCEELRKICLVGCGWVLKVIEVLLLVWVLLI